jgi:hypothetical protein
VACSRWWMSNLWEVQLSQLAWAQLWN